MLFQAIELQKILCKVGKEWPFEAKCMSGTVCVCVPDMILRGVGSEASYGEEKEIIHAVAEAPTYEAERYN